MYKRIVFCLCAVLIALAGTAAAQDSVPQFRSYQGVLLNGSGNPVTTPVSMRYSYYLDSTSLTPVFADTFLTTPDNQGRFSGVYPVGYKGTTSGRPASIVGIGVGTDPEMTPRVRLASAPFAFFAQSVKGDIQTDRGLLVMTSAAGDTTVKIDSAGNAHFAGTVKSGSSLILDGPNDRLLTDDGQMYLGRDPGTGPFSDVEVGIGTESPTATLHVEGTTYLNGVAKIASGARVQSAAAGGARILGEPGNTAAKPAIGFFSTNGVDDGGGGNGIYRPSANAMAFAVQSSERMRITGWGVEIGAPPASPTGSHALHVNGAIATAVATVTGNVTLTALNSVVLGNNSFATGAIAVTLPAANTCAGRQYTVKKISPGVNGTVSVQSSGADLIDGASMQPLNNQFDFLVVVSDGDSHWYIVGR